MLLFSKSSTQQTFTTLFTQGESFEINRPAQFPREILVAAENYMVGEKARKNSDLVCLEEILHGDHLAAQSALAVRVVDGVRVARLARVGGGADGRVANRRRRPPLPPQVAGAGGALAAPADALRLAAPHSVGGAGGALAPEIQPGDQPIQRLRHII